MKRGVLIEQNTHSIYSTVKRASIHSFNLFLAQPHYQLCLTAVEWLAVFTATVCCVFWLWRRNSWRRGEYRKSMWLLELLEGISLKPKATNTNARCQRSAPQRRNFTDPSKGKAPEKCTSCFASISLTTHTLPNWHFGLFSYWTFLCCLFYLEIKNSPYSMGQKRYISGLFR